MDDDLLYEYIQDSLGALDKISDKGLNELEIAVQHNLKSIDRLSSSLEVIHREITDFFERKKEEAAVIPTDRSPF